MSDLYEEDIYEYLDSIDNETVISTRYQDELVHKIHACINLDKKTCKIVLDAIFQEIRAVMLRGDRVVIECLGMFFISGKNTNGKIRVLPRFRPSIGLIKKMNHDR